MEASSRIVRYKGWGLVVGDGGQRLVIVRDRNSGQIHINLENAGILFGLWNTRAVDLVAVNKVLYSDLRTPLRVIAGSGGESESRHLLALAEVEPFVLGEWSLRGGQSTEGELEQHCLEIMHSGRPGWIRVIVYEGGGPEEKFVQVQVLNQGGNELKGEISATLVEMTLLRRR